MKKDRGTLAAAGMAYYWFLAVFPALLAAIGIFNLISLGPEGKSTLIRVISRALPGSAAQVLTDSLSAGQAGGGSVVAVVVGIALALWGASSGIVAIGGANVAIWTILRYLLGIGVLAVLFAAFYYMGPNRDSPKWVWVGTTGAIGAGA